TKNLFVCFWLLCIIFFLYSCMTSSDSIVKTMNYYSAGKYDKAITAGKKATAINADKPEGWYWLAHALLAKDRKVEAYNAYYYVTTLSTGVQGLDAYKNMCIIDYQNKDYDAYKANYQKAEAFYNKHKLEAVFNKSGENMTTIYAYLGLIYYKDADYDNAIKAFDEIVKFNVDEYTTYPHWTNHLCYVYRGWCYLKTGLYAEAIADYKSAIKIDGNDKTKLKVDYRGKAWAEFYMEDYTNALKDFNTAYEYCISTDTVLLSSIYQGKAFTYLALKDKETALSIIEKIITIDPDYDTNDDFAKIYYASGEKEKAWKYRGGSGYIGVEAIYSKSGNTEGAKIRKVETGSPAIEAGLVKGDIITMIDSKKVNSDSSFTAASHALIPGTTATIKIIREGLEKSFTLTIVSAEEEMENAPLISKIITNKETKKE
ncbi:MAG: tetratricopeptide repeat protein, partial [Bacteroidota bacterium]